MREMVTLKPPKKLDVACIILGGPYVAHVQEDGTVLVPAEVADDPNTLEKLGMGSAKAPAKPKAKDDE